MAYRKFRQSTNRLIHVFFFFYYFYHTIWRHEKITQQQKQSTVTNTAAYAIPPIRSPPVRPPARPVRSTRRSADTACSPGRTSRKTGCTRCSCRFSARARHCTSTCNRPATISTRTGSSPSRTNPSGRRRTGRDAAIRRSRRRSRRPPRKVRGIFPRRFWGFFAGRAACSPSSGRSRRRPSPIRRRSACSRCCCSRAGRFVRGGFPSPLRDTSCRCSSTSCRSGCTRTICSGRRLGGQSGSVF